MWVKDREGLRLFAESKALMTCFDLTIFFFILAEFAILNAFSAEQPNQRLDLKNFLKSCEIKRIISAVLMAMRQKKTD